MHCRVFSRIPGLYPLDARSTFSQLSQPKMFSVLVLVPVHQREGKISHWDEGIKYELVYISLFDYNI